MSHQAATWAAKVKTGGPSAKAVLMAVANYAGEHGQCWPSNATIAEETEQSRATVQRRMAELEEKGLIARFERFRDGGGQTTMEVVVLHSEKARAYAIDKGWAPDVVDGAGARQQDDVGGVSDCDGGWASDCNPVPVADCDPRGSTGEAPGVALVRPPNESLDEQSDESPPNPQRGSGDGDAALARWNSFEGAWGFDDPTDRREPARRAFEKLPDADALAAIAAAPRYRDQCRLRRRKLCHARTWLNERGWDAFSAQASVSPATPARVFIEAGSPQAAAWTRYHYEKTGKRLFMTEMNAPSGARKTGRYEETEWPPSAASSVGDQIQEAAQ